MEGGKQMFISNVIALMISQNKPYWWVMHYHDSKHIAESPSGENLDLDESAYLLRDLVKHLASGRYRIQISNHPKGSNTRGDVSHLVFSVPSHEDVPAQASSVAGIPDVSSLIAGLKKELEQSFESKLAIIELQHKHEKEMAELRKELMENQNAGINGFLNSEAGQQIIGAFGVLLANKVQQMIAPANQPQTDLGL